MISYEVQLNGSIKRSGEGPVLFIPNNEENRHYKEYLEWVTDGGIATNEVAPPVDEVAVLIEQGKQARRISDEIVDFVTGHNANENLNPAQLDTFETNYAEIIAKVKTKRLNSAKGLITAAAATAQHDQTFKDRLLGIFTKYGL